MTKRYLINLYPTGPFFFGGEITFGAGFRRNYLTHSEDLPQQTTLLGMLRYQLLAQNDLIPIPSDKKEIVKKLIGPASFQIEGRTDFGLIKALSPVFLMRNETAYRLNPVDDKYYTAEEELRHHALSPSQRKGRAYLGGRILDFIPSLNEYDHKAHYQDRVVAADGATSFPKGKVLCPVEQVGIQKSRNGQTLTNAFFKQTTLRFPSLDWSFAFYADLGTEYEKNFEHIQTANLGDVFVTLGGEQSLFRMQVKFLTDAPKNKPVDTYREQFGLNAPDNNGRIELLSDAYVTGDLYEHCQLAYTDTISFRGIKTTVQDTSHYRNEPQKTERLELLRRGSVLWSTKPEKTIVRLENTTFQTIGYNAFYNGPLPATALTQSNV